MKNLLKITALCILVAMQSCSSEDEPQYPVANQPNSEISKMVVRFNGKIYETDVKETGDSVSYLNEEYAEIYHNKIEKASKIAILLTSDEDGTTYADYYYSEEELLERYKIIKLPDVEPTRSREINLIDSNDTDPLVATAELYKDKDLKNDVLKVYTTTVGGTVISNFKTIGFNDCVTSIKLINKLDPNTKYILGKGPDSLVNIIGTSGSQIRPVLACFKDANFSGSVIYCVASPTGSSVDHTDSNLKKIKFNDKISSLGWNIVTDFSLFTDKDGTGAKFPPHEDC